MMKICAYPCHNEEVVMMNSSPLRYIHRSEWLHHMFFELRWTNL
jgi:hypothetical protein